MFTYIDTQADNVLVASRTLEATVEALSNEGYLYFKVGLSGAPFQRVTNLATPSQYQDGRTRLVGELHKTYRWKPMPTGMMLLYSCTDLGRVRAVETALIVDLRRLCETLGLMCMNERSGGGGRPGSRSCSYVYLIWA